MSSQTDQRWYTIKEAAAFTGLPASTLRYYESIGVIAPISRGASSRHRVYDEDDLDQLMWVACLAATGMSVADMRQYVANGQLGPAAASPRAAPPPLGARGLDEPPERLRVVEMNLVGELVDDEVVLDRRRKHNGAPVHRKVALAGVASPACSLIADEQPSVGDPGRLRELLYPLEEMALCLALEVALEDGQHVLARGVVGSELDPLLGRLMVYDALEMSYRTVNVRKDPDCAICGENPTVTELVDYEAFCGVISDAAADAAVDSTISVRQLADWLDERERGERDCAIVAAGRAKMIDCPIAGDRQQPTSQ